MNQPTPSAGLAVRIGVAFAIECRDAEGRVLKTIPVQGALSLPLTETHDEQEPTDGLDRSE